MMVNVRAKSGAGLKLLFPPWEAVIVQLPAAARVTVLPETVQLPVAAKLTASPEEAVAVTENGGSLAVLAASGLKVIGWSAFAMLNVRGTSGAGLKLLLPAWEAVIVRLPAAARVTVLPETVQWPVAAKLTARPDEAVAVTVNGGSLAVLSASGLKVIVWSPFAMLNVRGTSGAGLKLLFPPWEAVIVQLPAAVRVPVLPETVQLPVAAKLTARPEEAIAVTVNGGSPAGLSANGPQA